MGILNAVGRWLKTGGEGPIARQIQQALPKTYSKGSPALDFLRVPTASAAGPTTTPVKKSTGGFADVLSKITGQPTIISSNRGTTDGVQPTTPTTPTTPTETGQDQGGDQGESDYDAQLRLAREKQEEADRAAAERVRRYGEVIKPIEGDIETYLSSRPDLKGLFEKELETQGVSGSRARLGGFEKDVTNLQGQLETIPTEDINRRKETGMLTSAAERRIRSMEERPIREQLLKTQGAVSSERIGLDRAYKLVDKMLDMQREQEKRGLEPITTKLEAARGEFTNEVDALAQRLTGFNQARTDQLAVLKQKVANDQALTLQEQKAGQELIKQEAAHLNEMEQITARKKGQPIDIDKTPEIVEATTRILDGEFKTAGAFLDEYTGIFSDETLQKMLKDNAVSFRQKANDTGEPDTGG